MNIGAIQLELNFLSNLLLFQSSYAQRILADLEGVFAPGNWADALFKTCRDRLRPFPVDDTKFATLRTRFVVNWRNADASVLGETAVRLKLRAPGEPVIPAALQRALARPLIKIVEPAQSPARADRRVIVFFTEFPPIAQATFALSDRGGGFSDKHYFGSVSPSTNL